MGAKTTAILVSVAVILGLIGCRAFIDRITPADIPEISIKYAGIEPNTVLIPTLNTAKDIRNKIIINHRNTQVDLLRLAADDKYAYQNAKGLIEANIKDAEEFQELIIGSEDQPYSILGLLAPLGAGALVGKQFFRRKGDYTPEEFAAALIKEKEKLKKEIETNGKTTEV